MDLFNGNLYLIWVLSMVPMLAIGFYGLLKCSMHVTEFVAVVVVSFIPIINTMVLAMLILFSLTGAFRRNDSNQY